MSTRDALILDDVFEVFQKDKDGKKFDRGGLRRGTDGKSTFINVRKLSVGFQGNQAQALHSSL
jgi:hypothetical protein